jgi:hypothetical protein
MIEITPIVPSKDMYLDKQMPVPEHNNIINIVRIDTQSNGSLLKKIMIE